MSAAKILQRQACLEQLLKGGWRDFEAEHHLVLTPPRGTPVELVADSAYLRDYHGAGPGRRGTVAAASRLNRDDTGVLVEWGAVPGVVRMDLHEIKLAVPA